ncbi:MAG: hypothetical protein GY795_17115 [Desulfobacterales bacterium]|nr:hypothetical protein [Desulfobacterales bacterium]
MTPKEYETLRNELIELLQNAISLDSVNKETRDILSHICRKTLENQFEIVLAGEFQGGKSTTFNTLCDGRELSPLGSGIKTSGCIVAAQNISDSVEAEKALVEWRNSEELIEGFSDLLLPNLQNLYPGTFDNITASELSKVLNLDNPKHRRFISEAANQEWEVWEKNKAGYDPDQRGNLDILRSASIIAHHYANDSLGHIREKQEFRPEEIGELIIFPEDWEERWMDKNPDAFDIREVLFLFIRDVRLKLHCGNLGRLGCVLVDCPGLFASRWDTDVARRAMFEADAILYLFDGSRTMKLSDLRALRFIRKNGMGYKLFYGCNMRSHTLEDSERILKSTITMLKNNGFNVSEDEFTLFHALLALRSVQSERLLNGRLDKLTEKRIADEELPDKVKKRLKKFMNQQISILDIDDDDFTGMNPSSVQFARTTSRLDNLMEMVEHTVIAKKAKSILIDNGSQMAANSLLEVEGTLQNREFSAYKKENEFRGQVEFVEKELVRFRDDCTGVIGKLDEEGPDYLLSDEIWKRLEDRKQELCEKTSKRIYKDVVRLKNIPMLLFKRKKLKDKIIAIIKEEIDETFKEVIHGWVAEIKDDKNELYNAQIVQRIRSVSKDLKSIWNRSALPEMNLLAGVTIPEFSGNLEFDNEKVFRELEKSQIFDNVRYNAFVAAGSLTGMFTATSGIIVALFVVITRILWMVVASAVLIILNIIVIFLTQGMMEEKLEEEIRSSLSPVFDKLFHEIRADVKKEFREFSASIREIYRHVFSAAVNKPQAIFEERRNQAEEDFKKSRKEREAIAEEAKEIREEQIQPLRVKLQKFVAKVESCL